MMASLPLKLHADIQHSMNGLKVRIFGRFTNTVHPVALKSYFENQAG